MTDEHLLHIPRSAIWNAPEVCQDYHYDSWPKILRPKVLDIGANVGLFALGVCEGYKDARVMCFEPHPETFKLLKHNTQGLPIECHNQAVIGWQRSGPNDVVLHEGLRNRLCCSLFDLGDQDMATKIPVNTFLAAELPSCDVLKIDTEGAENEILEAYRHLNDVKLLMCEFHGRNADEKMADIEGIVKRANAAGLMLVDQRSSVIRFMRHA